MSFRALLAACVLAALPASAAAQLPTASADAIVAAAKDCAAATSTAGLDTEVLVAQGWKLGSASSDGEEISLPFPIYGKGGSSPILMVSPPNEAGNSACILTGRLKRLAGFKDIHAALSDAFGTARERDGNSIFRVDADIAVLAATGSRREPSFRLAVVEIGEKN